jgi:hypothetical protein
MRACVVRLAALAGVAVATLTSVGVEAAPIAAPHAIDIGTVAIAEPAQFFHSGKPYCWYQYGWAGPGWYWCGYGTRIGLGWGGVYGWNGWVVPRSYRAARMAPGQRFRRRNQ